MQNTLLDQHKRAHTYLRIAVTERCNLRCVYCMPPEGIELLASDHLLTFDEIVRFASICARNGVNKIRLTGGEPLVRGNLAQLVERLQALPGIDTVAITTNGTLLAKYAEALRQAGLSSVNISLDTLRSDRFPRIARRDDHASVLAGIDAALACGFEQVKINTVIMRGINDDELRDFVELTRDRPLHVRFIEFMPFDSNTWSADACISAHELRTRIAGMCPIVDVRQTDRASVARMVRIEGYRGAIGFISSMSEHFCDSCNRLRLTADGAIKACLFSGSEINVREMLRSDFEDAALEALIRKALSDKWEAHPEASQLVSLHNRSMIRIGG